MQTQCSERSWRCKPCMLGYIRTFRKAQTVAPKKKLSGGRQEEVLTSIALKRLNLSSVMRSPADLTTICRNWSHREESKRQRKMRGSTFKRGGAKPRKNKRPWILAPSADREGIFP